CNIGWRRAHTLMDRRRERVSRPMAVLRRENRGQFTYFRIVAFLSTRKRGEISKLSPIFLHRRLAMERDTRSKWQAIYGTGH
ncbi:MAG: hypothetical protein OET44_21215, partial [Gammaproteobacteria bacterium]|nr:hypothetical protein [Gammaproteobacteria bacterium]